jgi:hypothetical protein
VVAREEASADPGDRGRETTAVRAAEVTRTTIAMVEEEAARSPKPKPAPQPAGWESFDRPTPKPEPPKQLSHRAPSLVGSAGVSTLMGVDASATAFSTQFEIGVLRNMTAAARLDYPVEKSDVGNGSTLRLAPAFAGAGVGFPLTAPSSFMIPRVGAGIGLVWINATRGASQTFDRTGNFVVSTMEGSDSIASPAGYANVGLSMRVYGPLRFTVDGILGTTTSRLVVREQGVHMAYWGQPFGTLAMRVELMFQ